MIPEFSPGDTLKLMWISSDTAAASNTFVVYDDAETVVDTGTLIDSGSGLWYQNYSVPSTEGYYVARTTATISSNSYKRSKLFRVIELES